ncbi:MAG: ATP synthase F1 subunit gamma [Bacillota bacterium]|nr:ATP synthase F1 subunit gamma [Bacillota bacterium]
MASMSDIRRSIRSTESTGQITKAMKMVSSSKLRRAQSSVVAARPYADKVREVLGNLSDKGSGSGHPLQEVREVKNVLYVVVSGDRGLCGGFNSNIIKECEQAIKEREENCDIIAIGKKARDYFSKRNYNVVNSYVEIGDFPTYSLGKTISLELIQKYTEGDYDEVHLFFNKFRSAMTFIPTDLQLLPIVPVEAEEAEATEKSGVEADTLFEPSEEEVLGVLLPAYVETLVFNGILESKASEHGARMTAMSSATDNAIELIQSLTLTLNRARQAAITTEINEIVGGAAALE